MNDNLQRACLSTGPTGDQERVRRARRGSPPNMPPAALLVLCLFFIVLVIRLIVPRAASSARPATVEPLSAVADRVRAQLRALPETREPTTPEQS